MIPSTTVDIRIEDRVRLEVYDSVAHLTLARPQSGNAIDLQMACALDDAANRLASGTIPEFKAILLSAEGDRFCVGGDLKEFAQASDLQQHIQRVVTAAHEALNKLWKLKAPIVTAVRGPAAGAGVGIALLGDLVVADVTARFRSGYTTVGLSPDCGTAFHLDRLLSRPRALDMLLTNRPLSAEEAERWGLISRVVPGGDAAATACALAAQIAHDPAPAVRETLGIARAAGVEALDSCLEREAAAIIRLAALPDARSKIAAFAAGTPGPRSRHRG